MVSRRRTDFGAAPGDRDHQLAQAIRAFEQGDGDAAISAVMALVDANPGWVEGHVAMAQLLWQNGQPDGFEHFLTTAILRRPGDIAVTVRCLRMLGDAGLHAAVLALLPEVRRRAGGHLFFTLIEAVAASATDDLEGADRLFARAKTEGGGLSLPHVEHLLKRGDAVQAVAIAEDFVAAQPANQAGWGLLSIGWRLTGDPRSAWLNERPGLVCAIDLAFEPEALDALVARLRALHVARARPFDQSVRGGTQTNGNLLYRGEREIRLLRYALMVAVRGYLDALPAREAGHPLLSMERHGFHFSDSWSVRLTGGGYHISHIHPQGTLSSALYLALPAPCGDDPHARPHAGWLTLGEPPENLRTGLAPLELVEPKIGRLVLFPSYLWHGTLPFSEGERLTVAFDTVVDQ